MDPRRTVSITWGEICDVEVREQAGWLSVNKRGNPFFSFDTYQNARIRLYRQHQEQDWCLDRETTASLKKWPTKRAQCSILSSDSQPFRNVCFLAVILRLWHKRIRF